MMMGFGGLMILFWLILIIGGIWLVSRLFQSSGNLSSSTHNESDPLKLLDARYARGDISREEYQRIKQDLSD